MSKAPQMRYCVLVGMWLNVWSILVVVLQAEARVVSITDTERIYVNELIVNFFFFARSANDNGPETLKHILDKKKLGIDYLKEMLDTLQQSAPKIH